MSDREKLVADQKLAAATERASKGQGTGKGAPVKVENELTKKIEAPETTSEKENKAKYLKTVPEKPAGSKPVVDKDQAEKVVEEVEKKAETGNEVKNKKD